MAFIKHGDGKITTIITERELTEEQKKSVSDSDVEKSEKDTDDSVEKKSGR